MGTKKRQNKICEYREMLQAWKRAKVLTYAGYILGFPTDTPESIARDIEIIKKELPIDLLEFFYLTPLPASEDHKKLDLRGVPMDPDMNNYDLEHGSHGQKMMQRINASFEEPVNSVGGHCHAKPSARLEVRNELAQSRGVRQPLTSRWGRHHQRAQRAVPDVFDRHVSTAVDEIMPMQ